MPRPRRDSEILPAKERLENAFWELLSEREYRKITVTDIVRTADVNRNSFYYHFTGLPELADSAILHAVENTPLPSAPNANFNPDNEWRKHVTALLREPEQRRRLDRLALLAGPHSSPELVESLQDFGRLTLISVLGLDADHLDLKTDLMLDFTVGGHAGGIAPLAETPRAAADGRRVQRGCGGAGHGHVHVHVQNRHAGVLEAHLQQWFRARAGVSRRPSPAIRRTVSHTPHCVTFRW